MMSRMKQPGSLIVYFNFLFQIQNLNSNLTFSCLKNVLCLPTQVIFKYLSSYVPFNCSVLSGLEQQPAFLLMFAVVAKL